MVEPRQETIQYQSKNILMVIVKKQNLWTLLDKITPAPERYLVLKSNHQQYEDFFFVMYDSDSNMRMEHVSPTIVHRKGKCFYTINALNKLIQMTNNGVLDKQYLIDWDLYQNCILFLNKDKQFKQIPTKLYKIVN